ncbi:Hypothetical protein CINCED_3A005383 [Cinara cedri]|uniref:EF-hand domain pair n=1 Tax=Cinara cedri TaxID=506608 RepID=A0A5E4MAW8_9HEMI|nr:Hypothetical protein CINCED_3A005383 [Cinara cedri]
MQGVISKDEFSKTLKLMKKLTGIDDISMELIQNVSTEIQNELFKLVNDIYTTEEITEDFIKSL